MAKCRGAAGGSWIETSRQEIAEAFWTVPDNTKPQEGPHRTHTECGWSLLGSETLMVQGNSGFWLLNVWGARTPLPMYLPSFTPVISQSHLWAFALAVSSTWYTIP